MSTDAMEHMASKVFSSTSGLLTTVVSFNHSSPLSLDGQIDPAVTNVLSRQSYTSPGDDIYTRNAARDRVRSITPDRRANSNHYQNHRLSGEIAYTLMTSGATYDERVGTAERR